MTDKHDINDTLESWEKWPVAALFVASGLYLFEWYSGERLAVSEDVMRYVATFGGLAAMVAVDGAMIATVAGMRAGRRGIWSVVAILVTALFGALVALVLHGALPASLGAWLHAGFVMTIAAYLLHLAQPRATSAHNAHHVDDAARPASHRAHIVVTHAHTPAHSAHTLNNGAQGKTQDTRYARNGAHSHIDDAHESAYGAQIKAQDTRNGAHLHNDDAQIKAQDTRNGAHTHIDDAHSHIDDAHQSAHDIAHARALLASGASLRAVARTIGISESTLRKRLRTRAQITDHDKEE